MRILFVCLFLLSAGLRLSVLAGDRPNVLLILTDNQSYFELGCHGHPYVTTPHIDRLAAESVDFVNFHAPPFCSPSRALLMTGRYAMRSGIHNTIGGVSILHRDETTLADELGEAGYRTGVFGKWHLGFSYPYHPNQRGFEEAFVHGGGGIGQLEDYYGNDHLDATFDHNGQPVATKGFTTDVLFERARRFIRAEDDRPFFCFVSTPATHRPWQAHPGAAARIRARGEDYGKNDMALFSMIENIDENVGDLLGELEKSGVAKNTLVVFATDQGTRRERLHKDLGYDEFHQVFCMMRYPEWTTGNGRISKALSGMVDVFPTILNVCGVEAAADLDGRSLVPLLKGKTTWTDERRLIVQCPRGREREKWKNVSVKSPRWRLINGDKLFDALNDRDQLNDVSAEYPLVVRSLKETYERFWASLPPAPKLLSRHYLGVDGVGEVRLNAMDWYQGDAPWHQLHMPKFKGNGRWAIEVATPGTYRIELRHHPRESPQALEATGAYVAINGQRTSVNLDPRDQAAVIEMRLPAGQFDLETGFTPGDGSARTAPWGALFAYVEKR